jgi:predicted nucleic acid-binding protein
MVLVDTSVWVAHLRHGTIGLETSLGEAQIVCHPFVIGEIACGNLKNRKD